MAYFRAAHGYQAQHYTPQEGVTTLMDLPLEQLQGHLHQGGHKRVYTRSPVTGLWHEATLVGMDVKLYGYPRGGMVQLSTLNAPPLYVVEAKVALLDFPECEMRVSGFEVALRMTREDLLARRSQLETSFEEMIEAQELGVWRP